MFKYVKNLFARPRNIPAPTAEQTQVSIVQKLLPRRYRTYSLNTGKQKQLRTLSRNGIIRRGIERIKRTITSLEYELVPVGTLKKGELDRAKVIINAVLSNPNVVHNYKSFFDMILEDLIVLDAGVFNKCKSGNPMRPLYLYPVDAITIEKLQPYDWTNPKGKVYSQTLSLYNEKQFGIDEIAYLQMNHFTDNPYGLSPVEKMYRYFQYFCDALDGAADIASVDTAKFLIGIEGADIEQIKKFREYMANDIEGSGHIPVIGGKATSAQIGAINADSLFLEYQKFLLTLCAKCFDMPEQVFIEKDTNDRSTYDDIHQSILLEAVKPYADELEAAINLHVLQEIGIYNVKLKFKYGETMAQKTSKNDMATKKYMSGGMTENEYRAECGLEPSKSKYANMNIWEQKAALNKDYAVNTGGFNGQGSVKDKSDSKQ